MKNYLTTLLLALAISLAAHAQRHGHHVYIPGNGHLDVEQFIRPINTKMDISQLSLAELRILRNAFAARQGFVLKDADLRHIFSETSWYDSLMWSRFDNEESYTGNPAISDWSFFSGYASYGQSVTLTPAERDFLRRIQSREEELRWTYKDLPTGHRFRTDDMLNPFQLESMPQPLADALGRNGFAIVPGNKLQLFQVYEKNDYSDFPSFVTTDVYLQLFHLFFDCMVREMEQGGLAKSVEQFCSAMYGRTTGWNQAFFAVGEALITGQAPKAVSTEYTQMVADEIRKVNLSENDNSEFLGYNDVEFAYSLFRPRGHYTRNDTLSRYFRAMMWLQHVPFGTDKPEDMRNIVRIADEIGQNDDLRQAYDNLFDPITFLFGKPDNITVMQVYDEVKRMGMPVEKLLKDKKAFETLCSRIDALGEQQIRIRPKFESTSRNKVNLMPQRYTPDGEVLNEMIDAKSSVSLRGVPSGLDVFATMDTGIAEKVLTGELRVQDAWSDFLPTLQRMKERMKEIDWNETATNLWMQCLRDVQDTTYISHIYDLDDNLMPEFMRTDQWAKKNLNTALASWAEIKHDAILYAKQPMGAECGAGELPDPVLKCYVEPNVKFWKRAVVLNLALEDFIEKYELKTQKIISTFERVSELAEFLLGISRKELNNTSLSDIEYGQLEIIGSTIENISLDLIRQENQYLEGWTDVEGADRSVACVADVYTANARNNPEQCILYAATGPAYEIYVVVEIGNEKYLTRGAVLSYREFKRPLNESRLTDEEWQEMLKKYPTRGIPEWMNEIVVPLEEQPQDNEELFYSSGC